MDAHREAVQKMQDYIATHLNENITMADLSRVSQYSPWYSYRLFAVLLHMTPAVYIRRLRLSKSALRLRDEKAKIIDVAFDFGFESVDGYQRAFYREFGCNPYEYSVSPTPIYLFKPYGIKYVRRKEKKEMHEVKNVFVQVIEKPERNIIIKRGKNAKHYFEYFSVNIFCNNTTSVKQDKELVSWFVQNVYQQIKDNPKIEILLENTELGVG